MHAVLRRPILAATDLTEASDAVLRAAAALAGRTGAPLHVLHAFDFPPSPYLEQYPGFLTFQERIDDAETALAAQLARCVPEGVTVAGHRVDIYAAHRAIADYAKAIDAELVVIGPHARRAMELGFLGTTADRVIRTVDAPVLVVRGALRLPLRRVLVPLDLSEPARGGLEVALRWAAGLGHDDPDTPVPDTSVDIVHVIPRVFALPDQPFDRATVVPGMNREVEAAVAAVPGAGALEVREELLWGERPPEEIVHYAGEIGADLVVLATHGYGALRRALIGGTASGVARTAPCPVLLVPPRLWKPPVPVHTAAAPREATA